MGPVKKYWWVCVPILSPSAPTQRRSPASTRNRVLRNKEIIAERRTTPHPYICSITYYIKDLYRCGTGGRGGQGILQHLCWS